MKSAMSMSLLLPLLSIVHSLHAHVLFPSAWDGDSYVNTSCILEGRLPPFVEGTIVLSVAGAFGELDGARGYRAMHVNDAVAGVLSVSIDGGKEVRATGAYYNTRGYDVWSRMGRNMSTSGVPTLGWSPMNTTLYSMTPRDASLPALAPTAGLVAMDDRRVMAVSQSAVQGGLMFKADSPQLAHPLLFTDNDDIYAANAEGSATKGPRLLMHSTADRVDEEGRLWTVAPSVSADGRQHGFVIASVDEEGNREVHSTYRLRRMRQSIRQHMCNAQGKYIGDVKASVASVVSSISVTPSYVVAVLSSVIYNPCRLHGVPEEEEEMQGAYGLQWVSSLPLRVLLFSRRSMHINLVVIANSEGSIVVQAINAVEEGRGRLEVHVEIGHSMEVLDDWQRVDRIMEKGWPSRGTQLQNIKLRPRARRGAMGLLLKMGTQLSDGRTIIPISPFGTPLHFYAINPQSVGVDDYGHVFAAFHPFSPSGGVLRISRRSSTDVAIWKAEDEQLIVNGPPVVVDDPLSEEELHAIVVVRCVRKEEGEGVIVLLTAHDMREVGRVVLPFTLPIGLHSIFVPKVHESTTMLPATSSTTTMTTTVAAASTPPSTKPVTTTTTTTPVTTRTTTTPTTTMTTTTPATTIATTTPATTITTTAPATTISTTAPETTITTTTPVTTITTTTPVTTRTTTTPSTTITTTTPKSTPSATTVTAKPWTATTNAPSTMATRPPTTWPSTREPVTGPPRPVTRIEGGQALENILEQQLMPRFYSRAIDALCVAFPHLYRHVPSMCPTQ